MMLQFVASLLLHHAHRRAPATPRELSPAVAGLLLLPLARGPLQSRGQIAAYGIERCRCCCRLYTCCFFPGHLHILQHVLVLPGTVGLIDLCRFAGSVAPTLPSPQRCVKFNVIAYSTTKSDEKVVHLACIERHLAHSSVSTPRPCPRLLV